MIIADLVISGNQYLDPRSWAEKSLCPRSKTLGEEPLVHRSENPAESVVREDPVGQGQEPSQPLFLGFAEILKAHEALRPTQHPQYRDHQHFMQAVFLATAMNPDPFSRCRS